MALSAIDLEKGLDLTGLATITANDINLLIDDAYPKLDTADVEGKGMILWTVDSALGVAVFPVISAPEYYKWKRYIWLRIPHSTSTSKQPIIYAWNDNATPGTYSKWQEILIDTAALTADIAAAQADATYARDLADTHTSQINNTNQQVSTLTAQVAAIAAPLKFTSQLYPLSDLGTRAVADGSCIDKPIFVSSCPHGLPGVPHIVQLRLVCKEADAGYAANEEIPVENIVGSQPPHNPIIGYKINTNNTISILFYYLTDALMTSAFYTDAQVVRGDGAATDVRITLFKWYLRFHCIYFQ